MAKEIVHNPLEGSKPQLSVNTLNSSSVDDQISIIVVHRDRPEYLNILLQSIAVTSLNNNYEIIVVDNGSQLKDAQDFLDDLEKNSECKIIRNKDNLWFPTAANQGAKAADPRSKYFVFMHYDTVVLNPAWLDLMINVACSQDSGLVGVSMNAYNIDKQRVDFIEEWCMLLTRECYETCGPFCEDMPVVGASFLYTLQAQYADFKPQVVKNALVHHYAAFSVDVNSFENYSSVAMSSLPMHIRNMQSGVKKRKR